MSTSQSASSPSSSPPSSPPPSASSIAASASSPASASSASSPSLTPLDDSVLVRLLDLEEIDFNLYRGYSPASPRWGRVYGGQTVAQALAASYRTVKPVFIVHSLHAYFLRPGNDEIPILYSVERLRDGRSLAARRVTALQRGSIIFVMNVSFMTFESGREHADPMPRVVTPEETTSLVDVYTNILARNEVAPSVRRGIERAIAFPFPVDIRRVIPHSIEQRLKVNPARQVSWMRVPPSTRRMPDTLMLHQCALAYMSDWSLLETALLPHGLHNWISNDEASPDMVKGQTLQMASIDHAMWFHHSFRADEWMLYDMVSPIASNGRGYATGRIFTRDGKLVVTTAQEGMMRVIPPVPRKKIDDTQKAKDDKVVKSTTKGNGKDKTQALANVASSPSSSSSSSSIDSLVGSYSARSSL